MARPEAREDSSNNTTLGIVENSPEFRRLDLRMSPVYQSPAGKTSIRKLALYLRKLALG
jgi:CO dehydrogenase nickel-insertion accessory protein CooC1